jgi:hypothetical protein
MMITRLRRLRHHAARGSITVLAAVTLYIVVLLGVAAWASLQEGADHTLVGRLVADAAYDASHRTVDNGLVAGTPALACLDPSCALVTCPVALARDPAGMTAAGQACRALRQGLSHVYTGAHPRLDVAATLAATHVWTLVPGLHDPEDVSRVYHYPTFCLSTDATIGVIAHEGLAVHHHFHACAQAVYR